MYDESITYVACSILVGIAAWGVLGFVKAFRDGLRGKGERTER